MKRTNDIARFEQGSEGISARRVQEEKELDSVDTKKGHINCREETKFKLKTKTKSDGDNRTQREQNNKHTPEIRILENKVAELYELEL